MMGNQESKPLSLGSVAQPLGCKVCTGQIRLSVNEGKECWGGGGGGAGDGKILHTSYQCYETSHPQLPKIRLRIGHHQEKPFLAMGTRRKGRKGIGTNMD